MKKGFTLIETIIALSLSVMLLALGYVGYNASRDAEKITKTKEAEMLIAQKIKEYVRMNGQMPSSLTQLKDLPLCPVSEPLPSQWRWDGTTLYAVKYNGTSVYPLNVASLIGFSDSSTTYYNSYTALREPYATPFGSTSPPPPPFSATISGPSSIKAGIEANYSASTTGGTTPYSYGWSASGYISGSNNTATYKWTMTGNQTVTVYVTDSKGRTTNKSISVYVSSPYYPPDD